jgi:hypothetical protein
MALVQWTSSSGGDWSQAADWSGGAVPGSGDDVQIEVANITVTVGSGTYSANSLTTSLSAFTIDGGTLDIASFANIGGAFLESSGAITINGKTTFGAAASQSGGVLSTNNSLTAVDGFTESGGVLDIGGNGAVFESALSESAGLIAFDGNRLIAENGFTQTGGTMTLIGTSLFYGSLSQTGSGLIYEKGGLLTDYGSFSENTSTGGGLALTGGAVFVGAMSMTSGTVSGLSGLITANDGLSISGGILNLSGNGGSFYGTVNQTGGLIQLYSGAFRSFGAAIENGGQLRIGDQGGTFNNLSLRSGTISSNAATLSVSGTYAQTGGTLVSAGRDIVLSGPFSEGPASTIDVLSGALQLFGNGTIAGTLTGAGRLLVQGGTTTIASTAVLDLPVIQVFNGMLVYGSAATIGQYFLLQPQGQLETNGNTITLTGGASLEGEIVGTSAVTLKSAASLGGTAGLSLDGTSRLLIDSTEAQTGQISFGNATGSRTQIDIAKAGHLRITGNWNMTDASQNGVLDNAGALLKTAGSGIASVDTNVTSTGQIDVNIGTLLFEGPSNSFGGTISGAGTFALGGGVSTFASALTLAAARFVLENANEQLDLTHNVSYGNEWSQLGGTLWLNGATVSTAGETGLDGGLITGTGTFSAGAAVNISGIDIEGTATLKVAGAVAETGSVSIGAQIGSAPLLDILSTSVWTIENNASLGGVPNNPLAENATITNDGVVQKLNGHANSYIAGDFINEGTLTVANSQITLNGSGTLAGTLTGNGSLALSGNYLLDTGLSTSIGQIDTIGGDVTLGENLTDKTIWAQTGGTVSLGGNTLSLSGLTSLEGGYLSGPGTLIASGITYLGDGYTIGIGTLVVTAHATQLGDITVGDFEATGSAPQAGLLPPSLATVEIAGGATYTLADSNNIASNGTLAVAGTFAANGAGLSIIGPSVVDTGVIEDNAAALRFLGPVSGAGSIVIGAGGLLDFQGSVAASTTVSFASGAGSMFLEDEFTGTNNLTFDAQVAGFQTSDFIEFGNLSPNLSQITLSLNGGATGTIATLTDASGDSASITFTSTQTLSALTLGFGTHGDIALFHH